MDSGFKECAVCRAKPGSPELCGPCQYNRKVIRGLTARIRLLERHCRRLGWMVAGMVVGMATLALLACGGDGMPMLDEDAKGCCRCIGPDCPDGGPGDAEVFADGGLPQASTCDPRLEQCAVGLTCRYDNIDDAGEPTGLCEIAGAAAAGAECQMLGDPDCGPQMDCFVVDIGLYQECRAMCSPSDPTPRCGELACIPQPHLGADFGHCEAP
jgi:hypothetical protein